jgi:hypothetical protein
MKSVCWVAFVISGVGLGCANLIDLDAGKPNRCEGVSCAKLDECHELGECNPESGKCSNPIAEDGKACDDKNACTRAESCKGGVCTGEHPTNCAQAGGCQNGQCDPITGICGAEDGSSCDDGDVCTTTDTCQGGVCNPGGGQSWATWKPEGTKSYAPAEDVVVDMVTRRIWQRASAPQAATWQEAQAYCASLSLPGYPSGWRLPARIELTSLVNYAAFNPAIDGEQFPSTLPEPFWSSTPYADSTNQVWYVDFKDGSVLAEYSGSARRVRCVR